MLPTSLILRLAKRLHAAWATKAGVSPDPDDAWRVLDNRVVRAHGARHRIELARDKGLSLIVPQLMGEVSACLNSVLRQVEHLQNTYGHPRVHVPDFPNWIAEVRQLETEFDDVEVRWGDTTIRVVTEPIVLDDVHLGAFAIDFVWDRVGRLPATRCFDVIALDPNPAVGRDDVTHPHVRDGTLCPGDAEEPLNRALASGRLTDAILARPVRVDDLQPALPARFARRVEWVCMC